MFPTFKAEPFLESGFCKHSQIPTPKDYGVWYENRAVLTIAPKAQLLFSQGQVPVLSQSLPAKELTMLMPKVAMLEFEN